jgi:hypothetical protein
MTRLHPLRLQQLRRRQLSFRQTPRALTRLAGLLLPGLLLAAACGSPNARPTADSSSSDTISAKQAGNLDLALRVTYRDTRNSTRLELVSQSHTDAVELYSKKRASADTKVQTDKAIYALLQEFDARDFDKYTQKGRVPDSIAQSLEVQDEAGTRYFARYKGQPIEAQKAFVDCLMLFNLVYNQTEGLQAIENQSGGALFDKQKQKIGSKP